MKRIVKETLDSGITKYRVQKRHPIFRFWYTDSYKILSEYSPSYSAIFNSLKEALDYCEKDMKVVKKEILYTQKTHRK